MTPVTTIIIRIDNQEIYAKLCKHTAKNWNPSCNHRCLSCDQTACKLFICQQAGLVAKDFSPGHINVN